MNRNIAILIFLMLVAFAARAVAGSRQGLDVDELFSLAMATGHSVEQPRGKTRPELGDFVQAQSPKAAMSYRRYAEHDSSPAGMGRVVRAVFLSDTNPPLYYMLLNLWTRVLGTGDRSLRLLSILFSVACVPLAFLLGQRLYGRTTGLIAAALFALAPQAVFYGAIGRMYSLLCLLVLVSALLTLRMHSRPTTSALVAWILCSAIGLLTHYFFALAWAGMCAWLLLYPHRLSRWRLLSIAGIVLLLVMPWYAGVPESLEGWRVTKGWLEARPPAFNPLVAQVRQISGYFVTSGDWMNREGATDFLIVGIVGVTVLMAVVRSRRFVALRSTHLLLLWLAASMAGLIMFDLIQDTYARQHSRYAFVALPAALLLLAAALARLPYVARAIAMVALLGLWGTGILRLNVRNRGDNPFSTAAASINAGGGAERVVVVHAIPTMVMGYARYVDERTLMLDWVEAHGTRTVERDAAGIAAVAPRVTLVKSPPARVVPEETWFTSRAASVSRSRGVGYEIVDFVLRDSADRASSSR